MEGLEYFDFFRHIRKYSFTGILPQKDIVWDSIGRVFL